jgi:hypothetical protein
MNDSLVTTISQSKDLAEALSYWATAAGILVAMIAGAAASWRYFRDQKLDHWKSSNELYGEFLNDAIAHPEFYSGCWADGVSKSKEKANQYSYFIAKFLWICEQIVLGKDYDEEWRDCLKIIIREHIDYLDSIQFRRERVGYSRAVIDIIDEVLVEPKLTGSANA